MDGTVPWVALWSGERDDDLLPHLFIARTSIGLLLRYADEVAGDRFWSPNERTPMLWVRERQGRTGEPLLGEFNARRQVACMTRSRCQVCGKSARTDDGRVSWLFSQRMWNDYVVARNTPNPPTCLGCVGTARSACPHLSSSETKVVLAEAYVDGVVGDSYDEEAQVTRGDWAQVSDRSRLQVMLAKQLTVRYRSYEEVA